MEEMPGLILVRPAHAGNVGACLRLAANFGMPPVRVVAPSFGAMPKDRYWDEVRAWAWRAGPAVQAAPAVFPDLASAAHDHVLLIGTAPPGRSPVPCVPVEEAAARLRDAARQGPCAWVLGGERNGLGPEEWCRVACAVEISTEPAQPDLNLAQAAAILAWESAKGRGLSAGADGHESPASTAEAEQVFGRIRDVLAQTGYLLPNAHRILPELRAMLARAGVTRRELDLLTGIAGSVSAALRRAEVSGPARGSAAARDPEEQA